MLIISGSSDTYINVWRLELNKENVKNTKVSKIYLQGSYHLDD